MRNTVVLCVLNVQYRLHLFHFITVLVINTELYEFATELIKQSYIQYYVCADGEYKQMEQKYNQ